MAFDLTAAEVRVVGCLMEKEVTVPDQYPLSANALVGACNQSTNRWPVVSYDEATVMAALDSLRTRRLTRTVYATHGRGVTKYRHVVHEELVADPAERAVLTVLALRGPQTPGELKSRTERLHPFADTVEVEAALEALAGRDDPLVARLGRGPGQKESRYAHLLSGPVDEGAPSDAAEARVPGRGGDRLAALEARVEALEAEVAALRALLA